MNDVQFERLLSPFEIGPVRVRKRSVFTAHRANFGWHDSDDTGEREIAYLRRKAIGGVGLIIVEPLIVLPTASAEGSLSGLHAGALRYSARTRTARLSCR